MSIYECEDEEGEWHIQFWAFERNGKKQFFEGGDSLFANLEDARACFAGNNHVARAILCMGWPCWEDELELDVNQKLLEAVGDDFGGELNASKMSKQLSKWPTENWVVFRSVWTGRAELSLSQVESNGLYFTPEGFEVDDMMEAARIVYRSKN